MENKNDIGKAINDKLSSLDKTPKEQVWSGINYELQKKKKRRIGLFFFWGKTLGLLLISAIACLYIYNQSGGFSLGSPNNIKEIIKVKGGTVKTNTKGSDDIDSKNKSNEINISNISIDSENATESNNSINNKKNISGKTTANKAKQKKKTGF